MPCRPWLESHEAVEAGNAAPLHRFIAAYVLTKKCAYKGIFLPSLDSLEPHRSDREAMWDNMLGHQLPVLPPVADFWAALPELFVWIMGREEVPQPPTITAGATETTNRTRELPRGIPMRTRGPQEMIRFAAANHRCVDLALAYDGSTRRIEPDSLRETRDGNFVLHATRSDSGESRSYGIDSIQGATVTDQSFSPRFLIELTTAGPLSIPQAARTEIGGLAFARPMARRTSRAGSGGPAYVYRCPICGKSFDRRSMDSSLIAHKNPHGYSCPGRSGIYVQTKY